MRLILQIVGGIWAGLGVLNIVGLFGTTTSSTLESLGLIFNMVLFVLPGLVLCGIGSMMKAEPSYIRRCHQCAEIVQPAAIKCRFCGSALNPMPPPARAIPKPKQPMKRSTKIALSAAAAGLVVAIIVISLVVNAQQAKRQAEERVRQEQISREIAFMDARSKLAKKYPGQAQEIRAAFMKSVPAEYGAPSHEGSVTNAGGVYNVSIAVGKTVYHCAGPPNDQECQ